MDNTNNNPPSPQSVVEPEEQLPTPTINVVDDSDSAPALAATVQLPPPKHPSRAQATVSLQLKDPEVKDYGWNVPPNQVPAPVLNGISNDDLYLLLRRFNKQIFHVKAVSELPTGSLDLEYNPKEEFSPDKFRATLERLYMTVIVGMVSFGKQIARLRSWNEPWRTSWFCLVYYIAWFFRMLLPLFLAMLATLILEPRSRKLLFPPAPLAMISAKTGNIQKPKSDSLGSVDSLSGAQEKHLGEAVEQEARHFVSGFATIAVSAAAGKGPGDDGDGNAIGGGEPAAQGEDKQMSSVDGAVPDPVSAVLAGVEAKDLASGDDSSKDAAKKPVIDSMWEKARPIMNILEDLSDGWERWANALSPTLPFSRTSRNRIAAPLLTVMPLVYIVKTDIFVRLFTFVLGIAFFGQPLIVKGARRLAREVPNWHEYLELRRTLLIGVPTNAQLTLTLLRIGEASKAPLPPPPTSLDAPTAQDPGSGAEESDVGVDLSNYSVDSDAEREDSQSQTAVRAGVSGALTVDYVKAAVGSEYARRRVGAVSDPPLTDITDADVTADPMEQERTADNRPKKVIPGPIEKYEGPSAFTARWHGRRGHVLIVNSATSPCVAFVYVKYRSVLTSLMPRAHAYFADLSATDIHPEFTIPLADIVGLRKVGGFGWKGKIIVGWAMSREIVDGLEITGKDGKSFLLTAIRGRDELFNRLIAIGGQKWECW
ncbi:hypothetical protein EUX98_g770 [Antrodiella citrinella]|uniref:Uncharacterized protein n=1 Tax=Antrodiella citrinella TaxID=2447956 RepID=A0A4S4N359_9APHY|nr:hypothetical protein EUX98_g770 [Antrodiella citrinella]